MKRTWIALTGTVIGAAAIGATAAALIVPALAPQAPAPPVSPSPAVTTSSPAHTERERIALDAARIMTTWTPATDHNRTAAERDCCTDR